MKILLLLTHSFPYGSGEDFISAELKYISGFDKVFICPCSREKDAIQTKPIPDSIKCMPVSRTGLGKKNIYGFYFTRVSQVRFSVSCALGVCSAAVCMRCFFL